jgi:hypothetical protein
LKEVSAGAEQEAATLEAERSRVSNRVAELRRAVSDERTSTRDLNSSLRADDSKTTKVSRAVYLMANNRLDAGTLELYWDRIRFAGWHGEVTVSLGSLNSMAAGISQLAKHVGLPIVGERWPGDLQRGEALLLSASDADSQMRKLVFTNLPEGSDWLAAVASAADSLRSAQVDREEAEAQLQSAQAHLAVVRQDLWDAEQETRSLSLRVDATKQRKQAAARELSLPDWETKTVSARGSYPDADIQRRIDTEERDGWELVSVERPQNDRRVATLRRVRRFRS